MLKIKDNLQLEELENFGFKPKYDEDTGKIIAYIKITEKNLTGICVKKTIEHKRIRISKHPLKKYWEVAKYYEFYDIDTLYDLIKADLVEKVGE